MRPAPIMIRKSSHRKVQFTGAEMAGDTNTLLLAGNWLRDRSGTKKRAWNPSSAICGSQPYPYQIPPTARSDRWQTQRPKSRGTLAAPNTNTVVARTIPTAATRSSHGSRFRRFLASQNRDVTGRPRSSVRSHSSSLHCCQRGYWQGHCDRFVLFLPSKRCIRFRLPRSWAWSKMNRAGVIPSSPIRALFCRKATKNAIP